MKAVFPASLLWLICTLIAAPSVAGGLPASVASALREAGIPQQSVAIVVRQVDQRQPLVALNAGQPMNPASTMKLLTTYAGLEMLGPAYAWKTEVYAGGEIRDGILQGDLYLKGYGDPALSKERFLGLLQNLRAQGLREISGKLVIDNHWFEPVTTDAAAFDGEPYRAYNAPPDAMLVNYRATRFGFRGDGNSKVVIEVDPALPQLRIVNQVELRQVPCADWKDRIGHQVEKRGGEVTVTFSGSYSVACGEKTLELSALDNAAYVHALFRNDWQALGGTLQGDFRESETPPGLRRLAAIESAPLADVIRQINKYSNNLMSRQLLLTLGAEKQGSPGNVAKGIASIEGWLADKKMTFSELQIENGAGLSRRERISAGHLADLLLAAWRSPVMPELMASLPIVAVDGTLQNRLKESALAGQGHLKTGSLDGVRTIAGYLLDSKGRRWVVVFMVNHANAQAARRAQDALLEWLYLRD